MEYMVWAGTIESYEAYQNLQKFLIDPKYFAESKINAFLFNDDDDDEAKTAEGIGGYMVSVDDGIATVSVSGTLINSYSPWNKYFGVVSYAEIRSAVEQVIEDTAVETVVMNYDTGGGMESGLDETALFLSQANKVKPIISYTGSAALSGGYWLASTGSKFYAAKTAQVGSIGVILVQASQHRMYEEAGIDINIIRAGKNKALGHPMEELSAKGRAKLQADVDKIYEFFTSHVAQHRGISRAGTGTWAEGNVFFAEEAQTQRLVDGVTYYNFLANSLRKSTNNGLLSFKELDMEVENMKTNTIVANEADLAKLQAGVTVETTEVEVEETETTTDVEAQETETTTDVEVTETVTEVEASDEPAQSASAQILSETQDKLLAATAKLAVAEQSLTGLQSKATTTASETELLVTAVILATNRLQISLNQSPTKLKGLPAATVIEQWTQANEDFSKVFKVGSQAKAAKIEADIETLTPKTKIRAVDGE